MSDREPSWEELADYLRAKGWTGRWMTPTLGMFHPPLGGPLLRIDMREDNIGFYIAIIAGREGRGPGDVKRDIIDGIDVEPAPEAEEALTLGDVEDYAYKRYAERMGTVKRALSQTMGLPDFDTPLALGTELRGVVRLIAWLKATDKDGDMYWAREAMHMDVIYKGLAERFAGEHPSS